MIQTVINRFKCLFDLSKIDQPAGMYIHLTTQLQTDKKGMPVQTPAFMAFGTCGRRWAASNWNSLKIVVLITLSG